MPGGSSDLLLSEMLAEPVTSLATKGDTNHSVSEAGPTTELPKESNPNNIAVVSGSSPELPRAELGIPFREATPQNQAAAETPSLKSPPTQPQMVAPKHYAQFVVNIIQPEATLDLTVGLPKILVLDRAPKRVRMERDEKGVVGGVATVTVISKKELSILGRRPGRTVLNLWFADPKDPTKETILSYLVQVAPDPQTANRVGQWTVRQPAP
jgi:hypothetical protein